MANAAEEYTALYLRLNGFLILPNFTHLSPSGHAKESDIIGIRCPRSAEKVKDKTLPVDERLFNNGFLNKDKPVPIIAEIKGGNEIPVFDDSKIAYISNFFGNWRNYLVLLAVSGEYSEPMKGSYKTYFRINMGVDYLVHKTKELIHLRAEICNKASSWYLNEGLLQKLIFEENRLKKESNRP